MPDNKQEVLACANYLGIDPARIANVETTQDGGGHFTGLKVVIHIPTGREVDSWVKKNLPQTISKQVN